MINLIQFKALFSIYGLAESPLTAYFKYVQNKALLLFNMHKHTSKCTQTIDPDFEDISYDFLKHIAIIFCIHTSIGWFQHNMFFVEFFFVYLLCFCYKMIDERHKEEFHNNNWCERHRIKVLLIEFNSVRCQFLLFKNFGKGYFLKQ